MSTRFGLYIYPWDLEESAANPLLRNLKGAGISRLHIAASYHAGKFLRPHGHNSKVYFPEDGTVYFQPRETYGLLKPKPATMVPSSEALAPWWQAGFEETAAWTVVNHNSRLGWMHRDCCAKNAFGDAYPYSLCPSNAEVLQYSQTLCQDMAHLPIQAIQLESPGFLPFAHGYHHEFQLVDRHFVREYLLGLCFCTSCKHQASTSRHMDPDQLQNQVVHWIEESWAHGPADKQAQSHAWQKLLDGSPTLQTFLQWRCDQVTRTLEAIRAALPKTIRLEVIPSIQNQLSMVYLEGSDLAAMAKAVDRLELPLYHADTKTLFSELDAVLATGIAREQISVILRPGFPDLREKGTLAKRIQGVLDRGIQNLNFYNFGHLPKSKLQDLSHILETVRPT